MAKRKPKTPQAKLIENLNTLWPTLVKACGYCEVCGSEYHLNAHHLINKRLLRFRWDLHNGMCLCAGHHTFGSVFRGFGPVAAHGYNDATAGFLKWFKANKPRQYEWFEANRKNHTPYKPDYEAIYAQLLEADTPNW